MRLSEWVGGWVITASRHSQPSCVFSSIGDRNSHNGPRSLHDIESSLASHAILLMPLTGHQWPRWQKPSIKADLAIYSYCVCTVSG